MFVTEFFVQIPRKHCFKLTRLRHTGLSVRHNTKCNQFKFFATCCVSNILITASHFKGGESPSQFRWFTRVKIKL